MKKNPLQKVFELIGSQAEVARKFGLSREAIRKWKKQVPAGRVLRIEKLTNGAVTRHELRPDLYPID